MFKNLRKYLDDTTLYTDDDEIKTALITFELGINNLTES